MTSNHNESRKFRIEGSGIMLNALAEATALALRAARLRPDRTGTGSVTHGHVTIEVAATDEPDGLTYAISSIEDAVRTISGWAETKRCQDCDVPIAMLFDDAYLETPDGDGVVCCRCWRRREDDDEG